MSEAEENGYQGTYFTSSSPGPAFSLRDGYIKSSSPEESRKVRIPGEDDTEVEVEVEGLEADNEHEPLLPEVAAEVEPALQPSTSDASVIQPSETLDSLHNPEIVAEREHQQSQEGNIAVRDYVEASRQEEHEIEREGERDRADSVNMAEVVFFAYGVVVFFGLEEGQERSILEDVEGAGVMRRKMAEEQWEVEECHYAVSRFIFRRRTCKLTFSQYDSTIQYPRIYNDFFSEGTFSPHIGPR